ncbi:copper homeostasis protein CutC [Nocardioides marmoriginsengisoli]|uniref:Copper homeostasis protein cutC homolog n=1 Tax=Nocardioides marmoriginsengisoli TaxID=661483 RepID=A0A3N0CRT8_9ACTN|nr:copper homeostasis protein CutC [Nocardioides marmoriginsengisoli]RNL66155.1 copper homeostasis protein CutC [Nocardioides marmoriginsengisoli]
MTIVSPACESAPLLEVVVLHARDAAAATAGEADRLLLVAQPELGGRAPEPSVVSAVLRETDLPVRVTLRIADSLLLEDSPYDRLVTLARTFVELGAEGVSFGFLDGQNDVDHRTCTALANDLAGVPWSFHQAFDAAFDARRAWRDVLGLPGLDAVVSAGSTRGLARGAEELIGHAATNPRIAALALASGGLDGAQVPWLVRAGIRQFGLSDEVRQDGSWTKSYVDPAAVRAWRLLLDDAHQLALGIPVD